MDRHQPWRVGWRHRCVAWSDDCRITESAAARGETAGPWTIAGQESTPSGCVTGQRRDTIVQCLEAPRDLFMRLR